MTLGFIFGTKNLKWQWVVIITAVVEYLIVQPRVCELYYSANKQHVGITRFIPFWNEVIIFKSSYAMATLISYIAIVIAIGVLEAPVDLLANVVSEHFLLNYKIYDVKIIMILVLINSIFVGLGFQQVTSKIKQLHAKLSGSNRHFSTSVFSSILLFIPIIRLIPLIGLMNMLTKIVVFNNFTIDTSKVETLIEE
jgi:hypothetical protein